MQADPVGWLDRTSAAEQRQQKKGIGAGAARGAPEGGGGVSISSVAARLAAKVCISAPEYGSAAAAATNSSFISKDSIINGVGDKKRSSSRKGADK